MGKFDLHDACTKGDLSKVRELFLSPEDLQMADEDDDCPLACAIKSGYLHIVQFFVNKVGDVNIMDDRARTPLYHACLEGMTHIVKWLLESGADLRLRGGAGDTPINLASRLQNEDRQVEILKLLLDKGADPSILNHLDDSPLTLAFEKGNVALVKLYKTYVDIDLYKPQKTKIPYMTKSDQGEEVNLLYLAVEGGSQELITYLIENGVDFKDREKLGFDTLPVACTSDDDDFIKFVWETIYNNNVPEKIKNKAIHTAAAQCYESTVELLLDLGCDREALNDYLETPLLPAVIYSRTHSAGLLMERGADIQSPRFDGKTALHLFCHNNDEVDLVLEKLLAGSEDINLTDLAQRTPLHYAAMAGSSDVIKFLVEHGADQKAVDCKKATALHYLCGCEKVEWDEEVFECLAKDVGIEALDEQRRTPLHYAADSASLEYFQNLVDYGANVNAISDDQGSLLHRTLAGHQWSKAEFLLEKGVYNDEPDIEGKTPLLYSIRRMNLVEMLLDKGANIHAVDKNGQTVLHLACEDFKYESACYDWTPPGEVAELLVQRGCNVNAIDNRGRTPLHLAYACGNESLIEVLLSHGADKKAVDNEGKNILHYAVQSTETNIVESVLKDASLNVPDKKGHRPLFYSCDPNTLLNLIELTDNVNPDEFYNFFPVGYYIDVQSLEAAFERGASVNSRNEKGDTLLHEFVRHSKIDEIQFLLSKGADVNAKNVDLVTPLHMAVDQMWLECVKLLVEHGGDTSAKDKNQKSVFEHALEHEPRYEKMLEYLVDV